MNIYIGCSGFSYNDWKEKFYPKDIPKKKWLEYYSRHFNTVELNSTFYRTPKPETFQKWYDSTPDHFRFSVKGSRYITHLKQLKQVDDYVQNFFHAIQPLKEKTGCVLWQLPPKLKRNDERLEAFLKTLPAEHDHTVEFRNMSWFDDEVYQLLDKYNVSLCLLSAPDDLPEIVKKTGDAMYIRFHGKTDWYTYDYSTDELKAWHQKISEAGPETVYAYFNNDYEAYAVHNAKELMSRFE
jgi:uncharacterized protein YecE (DUF72 family)